MKNYLLALFLISFITISAQYQIKSPYLISPESVIPYVDSCAQFWIPSYDQNRGGFYTNVDKQGNVITSWGKNKNTLTQTRNAYGFARAYMLTGNDEYLDYAKGALNFMYDNAWDEQFTGWFAVVDEYGNPQMSGKKSAFDAHYALLGILTYYETTRDTLALNWLNKSLAFNENALWDSREDYFGYYDNVSRTTTIKNGKSFNATVDAITTHLLYLYLLTKKEQYLTRLEQMGSNILDHLVASMEAQQIGFAEDYDREWNINESETLTIMGHVLKTGWCLARINYLLPKEEYIVAAEKLVNDVLEKGYDHEFGGPYKDYNRVTGVMQMWGVADTGKAWWQMEQAITAGLQLYNTTGDDKYLKMADESLDFFMNYFVDHVYGEIYMDRTRYGGQLWSENKGDGYKAAYHSIETGFYVYLYGNLFIHQKPVSLYYKFDALDHERNIYMSPLAMEDEKLIITTVTLDGNEYTNFLPEERVLTIPQGTSGEFKVTYGIKGITNIADNEIEIPTGYLLGQNYPNPFNPSTKVKFAVPVESKVTVTLYSMLGQKVKELVAAQYNVGLHEVELNASDLASGMYIYSITALGVDGSNFVDSKKMMLMK